MLLIPRETNSMQIFFQYVTQQPFNKSSVMCGCLGTRRLEFDFADGYCGYGSGLG